MARIRILNAAQVGQLLTMRDVIEGVEEIYRLYSTGRAGVWPTIFHEFQPGVRDMDIKSGFLDGAGVFGLKMVAWSAENPSRGLPALSGVVVVADVDTGFPLGIVDGMSLTSLRTGAAGAVGAARLARPDAARVLVCGTGAQGRAQLAQIARREAGVRAYNDVFVLIALMAFGFLGFAALRYAYTRYRIHVHPHLASALAQRQT